MSSTGKPTRNFVCSPCYSLLFPWQDVSRNGLWHTLAPVLLRRAETLYLWILQAEFSQRVALPKNSVSKIFADVFQNVESTSHKALSVTQGTRQPLNSVVEQDSGGMAIVGRGVMIPAIPQILPLFRQYSCESSIT